MSRRPYFLAFVLLITLGSCSINEQSSMKGCPISQYDNSKLIKGQLAYLAPSSWTETETSNPMRFKEYILDPQSKTNVAVYFFKDTQNQLEANLRRWKNQFRDDKARTLLEKKQFNRFKLPITVYHLTGAFLEQETMADPNSKVTIKPDSALLAAVVEMKEGTWFFKTVGPTAVIASHRKSFDDLVFSFHAEE
ncbi:MAG: hypothetical protein O3C63_07290 [Cyanobacteria bacterium]|nr:hypothetical protein [Cyanobacteriota bacterium]MDA1020963.1 hypothetical protein [Cyanobacteriota bacterium]